MFSSGTGDISNKNSSKPRFDPATYDVTTHLKGMNGSFIEKNKDNFPKNGNENYSEHNRKNEYYDSYETQSDGFAGRAAFHLQQFIKGIAIDDILLIGILILLLNENKEDDYLILVILAVLLFT